MGVAVAARRAAVRAKLLANMVAKCRWKPEGKGGSQGFGRKRRARRKIGISWRARAYELVRMAHFFTGVETNPHLPEDTRVCIELGVLPDLFPVQIIALDLPPVPTCTSSSGHFASIYPRYREITSSASSSFRAQINFSHPLLGGSTQNRFRAQVFPPFRIILCPSRCQ